MLASNSGESNFGFAICTRCGYADSEKKIGSGREKLPSNFDLHIPLNKQKGRCWRTSEAPVLRNHNLAALQVTDLVELDFTRVDHPGISEATTKTLGFALKLSGAETRDDKKLLAPTFQNLVVLEGQEGSFQLLQNRSARWDSRQGLLEGHRVDSITAARLRQEAQSACGPFTARADRDASEPYRPWVVTRCPLRCGTPCVCPAWSTAPALSSRCSDCQCGHPRSC